MSEQLFNQALTLHDAARFWTRVSDDRDYALVGQFIVDAKRLIAKITEAHTPSIKAAHEAHKAAIALRDSHIQPIIAALHIVEPLALDYKAKKDMEAKAEADAERKAKELVALADAEALEALGFAEDAAAKLTIAIAPTRITPQISTLPKVVGLSTRKRWTARIVDPRAVKREFCQPSESRIQSKVEQAFYKISQVTPEMIKQLEDEVGGIEVFEQETMVGRTK